MAACQGSSHSVVTNHNLDAGNWPDQIGVFVLRSKISQGNKLAIAMNLDLPSDEAAEIRVF
jgi:hypothetical protein